MALTNPYEKKKLSPIMDFGINLGQNMVKQFAPSLPQPNMVQKANQLYQPQPNAQPQQPKPQTYTSPYAKQIQDTLSQIQNRPQFNYNINNDPIAQGAIKDSVNEVTRAAARKNMIFSDGTEQRMSNAALQQGRSFYNDAYARDQNEYSKLLNQLQALQGMENTQYGRYRDTVGDERYNTEYADRQGQQQLENKRYDTEYGDRKALQQAEVTGYYNPYGGMQVNPEALQYAQDYQAEINRRMATPDTADDALIPDLQAGRANKIFADPTLLQKYGDAYKTPQQRQAEQARQLNDLTYQTQQYQLNQMKDPNSYDNRLKGIQLQTADTQLKSLAEELKRIQAVDPSFASREAQLKLAEIQSRINENAASASASYALRDQRKAEGTTTQKGQLTYKDYVEMGRKMIDDGFVSEDDLGNKIYSKKNDMNSIINWIKGLQISPEEKAKLANDLGLQK